MKRRQFLMGTSATALIAAASGFVWRDSFAETPKEVFEVEKTEAEWRKILTPEQFDVLRKQGTERPWTSPLNNEHRNGTFACAGCDLALYSSKTKFDSGTGWPSFFEPLPDAIRTSSDRSWLAVRTEVHCRRCGGHLGHVFDDGPAPTGQRYCMNGVAMKFEPTADKPS
jgi:peptide-methionine (R)-S-oxide reductase